MTRHAIQRDRLGSLTKIGQGGQGIVYDAPGFRTKFTDRMVFKEYKPDALRDMDFDALSAMPALVEDMMSYDDAERLIAITAWPCAIIEQDGKAVGQVMPAIPDQFIIQLKTARGTSPVNAEIQHLLNHASILEARDITITDVQRYSLLREIATDLAFLHRNGICVGDISPKNLLFSLSPIESAYLIDCDTMAVNGVSALPQVETPGWEVPAEGEPLATIFSDSYKLGLLALRLIVGDQDVRDVARIPARTPTLLRKIITDALTNQPERRPLPTAWTYILGNAIEEAQQRQLDSPQDAHVDEDPAPPIPVVRTRPKATTAPKSKVAGGQTPGPKPPPAPRPPADSDDPVDLASDGQRRNKLIGIAIAAAAVIAVVVVIVAVSTSSGGDSYTTTRTSTTSAYGGTYSEPTSESTAETTTITSTFVPRTTAANVVTLVSPPAAYFASTPDANNESCASGIPLPSSNGLFAGRGSEGTTCYFAENVGTAYVNSNPNVTVVEQVAAHGSRNCADVQGASNCTNGGRDFMMACSMQGRDQWVTCTGGNRAVVYIY